MTKKFNNNDITKSKNAKKEKVAVFMNRYGKKRLGNEWKKMLYNHCEINNYEIVSTFSYSGKVKVTELYDTIIKEAKKYNFHKIVVFDFREICLNALKLISLTEMLNDKEIKIEVVACTYLLDEILRNNIYLETWFEGERHEDYASFYDKDDYFYFMEELEYQQQIEILRLNQNREIEKKTIYSKNNEFANEMEEWL